MPGSGDNGSLIFPFKFLIFILVGGIAMSSFAFGESEPEKSETGNDLDAFMAKVLEKRDYDWEKLHNYIFNSKETLEVENGGIAALESYRREYVWFVRDGYLVRSPVKADGVKISAEDRAEAEKEWIEKEKKRKQQNQKSYLDRQSFFGFRFEPGRYLYAGKQQFEGRDVLAIEYYPDMGENDKIESLLEKSFLITLLIVPEEHQIVKFTFDNAGFEFLPARWLVRVNDIRASMTMDKPLGDFWLPHKISAYGSVSTANMDLAVRYTHEFYSYAKTHVKTRFWFETGTPPASHEK